MRYYSGKSVYFLSKILILLYIFFGLSSESFSQGYSKITLSLSSFQNTERITIFRNWKYHPGNSTEWAKSDFDDRDWELFNTDLRADNMPKSGFTGMGWFRLHISIDSGLVNKILLYTLWQSGKSKVYLDGKIIKEIDIRGGQEINGRTYWGELTFPDNKEHVLAVYFENTSIEKFHAAGFMGGFFFRFALPEKYFPYVLSEDRENSISQNFFTALPLAFALLHFILFFFAPTSKSNLYYALALIFYAAATFMDYQASAFAQNIEQQLLTLRIHRLINPLATLFFLRFIYSVFYAKLPKQFSLICIIMLGISILVYLKPMDNYPFYTITSILVSLEIFRILILFIKRKFDGAGILASGFLTLFLFSSYDSLMDLELIGPINNIQNMYFWGVIGLFIATSIYLSRDFTRTARKLAEQEQINREKELERKMLAKDNERKTRELEDARNLQISMLPKDIPQIPGLEIGVFMKTATEVGGDYYDFFRYDEKELIIAIGDATGHGTKSGNMVSIIKSLLNASKVRNNFTSYFSDWSKIIKQMNLGNLFMGITLMRINENRIAFSSAGMPPVYIIHRDQENVEEIIIKSMPLGAAVGFPYKEIEKTLMPNDTIILMTDGYLEQFNENMEMLETETFKKYLAEISDKSPKEIIEFLMEKSKEWMNSSPQTDDITFVAVKVV
jgi:serine phosphatase RsbU (regulator of sigma subunit)